MTDTTPAPDPTPATGTAPTAPAPTPAAPSQPPAVPSPAPAPSPDPGPAHAAADTLPSAGSLVEFTAVDVAGLSHVRRGVVVDTDASGQFVLVAPLPAPVAVHADDLA